MTSTTRTLKRVKKQTRAIVKGAKATAGRVGDSVRGARETVRGAGATLRETGHTVADAGRSAGRAVKKAATDKRVQRVAAAAVAVGVVVAAALTVRKKRK